MNTSVNFCWIANSDGRRKKNININNINNKIITHLINVNVKEGRIITSKKKETKWKENTHTSTTV